ncbi:uncharacterized protein [Epargyreus clarus]|uniref:uncharacterized protein n=1 Tax=Epargyreus clarus TaxID=520877 RepID=UPI003C2BB018
MSSTMVLSRSHLLLSVFFCLLLQYCVQSQQEVLLEESAAIESLHAPTGGGVELPCDVTPALPDDRMGLVIWYKQGHETPIYTLDTREGVTSHWSDPATLGARATFRSNTKPAVLVLTKLRPEDSGQYRCRVDFIKSPTKNTRLNLTVLIPPERLIVLNQEGNEVQGGVLGPYDEGTEVNLTCIAVGGRPTARVSWWKSHALLANSEARATTSFILQRSDYGTDITCQAVTDPSITPLSETLSIDVNLRPLWVRLQGGKRPLVAGQSTELVCQAVGARPKPTMSWWKGGTRLKSVRETTSTDGNVTNSILTFVPAIEDAGRVISCRAVQPTLPHSTHEDGWKMEIQHLPVVKLELGANLDASKVVEGSDVYLDCRVKANPWHNHVYFTHNGVIVKPGPGVLLANQSLVLQHVSRKAAGAYVCSARNSLGEGPSERLMLDVKYTPTCKTLQPIVLRAARGEIIEIECDLDANPKEPMTFHWWFNSSTHSKHELTTSTLNTQNTLGTFFYMVNTSSDYGWVQCTGTNSVGRQSKPCLYHILPADKPSAVKGCEITNVTYDSLTLNCTPGHDGGIRQYFLLQVFDMATGLLLRNISNEEPEFEVSGLSASSALGISVKAFNRKGSSEPVTLTSSLLKYPQRHTAQVPVKVELTTVLIIVLGAVGVIAALTAVSAVVFCCRYCNKRENKNEKGKRRQDETSNIPLTGTKESESVDSLDKNPDIIPLDGKISDSCSNKSSTTDYSSIRPLISKSSVDKYDIPPNCDRYYDHNIDPCNQYIQVRPMDYRLRQTYQTNIPMPNLGPSIQSLGPLSLGHMPNIGSNDCRPPYDKVYEDWLKYKNALPLNTTGLLPAEQLMPPELYATPPPPSLYSNPNRNPLNLAQMPELEPRYHLEPRSLMAQDNRTNSPPVRFNTDNNSAYFNKSILDRTSTLPHLKTRNVNTSTQMPNESKSSATKSTDTNTDHGCNQECG